MHRLSMLSVTGSLSLSPLSIGLLLYSLTSSRTTNILELRMTVSKEIKENKE